MDPIEVSSGNGPFDFYEATAIPPTQQAREETLACVMKAGGTREEAEALIADMSHDLIIKSSEYQAAIRQCSNGLGVRMMHISIKRLDRQPLRDWRALQKIKNVVLGEECEAVEIFPAESRLVDGANQYHLWGFVDPEARMPFGFDMRMIDDVSIGNSVQRPFESPDDLMPSKAELAGSLRELCTWMRDNTGPNDGTLDMLRTAKRLLDVVDRASAR